MINSNISQFKALLTKELKETFRDKRDMLSDVSAMMMACSTVAIIKGVAA